MTRVPNEQLGVYVVSYGVTDVSEWSGNVQIAREAAWVIAKEHGYWVISVHEEEFEGRLVGMLICVKTEDVEKQKDLIHQGAMELFKADYDLPPGEK